MIQIVESPTRELHAEGPRQNHQSLEAVDGFGLDPKPTSILT